MVSSYSFTFFQRRVGLSRTESLNMLGKLFTTELYLYSSYLNLFKLRVCGVMYICMYVCMDVWMDGCVVCMCVWCMCELYVVCVWCICVYTRAHVHACSCVFMCAGTYGGQRRTLEPLELNLQATVSSLMGVLVIKQKRKSLDCWAVHRAFPPFLRKGLAKLPNLNLSYNPQNLQLLIVLPRSPM